MLHSHNRDNTMKYVLIAGEASGDLHASHLIKHIRENDPEAEFRFFGGDLMAAEARRNPELHYNSACCAARGAARDASTVR